MTEAAKMRRIVGVLAAVLVSSAGHAITVAPPDPTHGEALARHWCAACHIVADDQAQGTDNVPTFSAVANRPGFDAARLTQFLRDPHPKMPDMQLSREESSDIAAYIASLRK
jgi:mono/diheme cytochrome c family protein